MAIDALAPGLDLAPLLDLMADPAILKVFHAARQDLEIFFQLSGQVPHPVFDTQIAAMVCGFGDAVSYETLVRRLAGAGLDKASRFTDWAQRPLTERQVKYALADVIHLRTVYERLQQILGKNGRASGSPRRWRTWSTRRSTAPTRKRRGGAFACAAAPTGAFSAVLQGGRGMARGGGAAARPAARPDHEG